MSALMKGKVLLLTLFIVISLLVCGFSKAGFAVPAIMLYIDGGADYYYETAPDELIKSQSSDLGFNLIPTSPNTWFTDSFVTFDSAFTLVIETNQRGAGWSPWFYDMHLVAAVPEGETGSLTVTRGGSGITGTPGSGTPTYTGYGSIFEIPPHGVFPTDYFLYSLNDIEDNINEPVYLDINWSGYSKIHFDAFAYNKKKNNGGEWVVNPFSHDVTTAIPEPGTLLLFGTGLLGMIGSFARKRFREFKRVLDTIFASVGLVLLSPLFLIMGILIRIDSKGSIFYKQMRVGEDRRRSGERKKVKKCKEERRKIASPGRLFMMYKFRTMKVDAEAKTGPIWAQENDGRVTRLGHFLRKTHLDELPQFINVLKGEMSLIGPRPERPVFVNNLNRIIPKYNNRLNVKPGITGLAQVRYKYDETTKDVKKKVKYDLLYVKKRSWTGEARVVFWTVISILTGRGVK